MRMLKEELRPRSGLDTANTLEAALRLETALPGFVEEAIGLEQEIIRLFEQWRAPIYEYLTLVFGHPAEAEEIVQDAFLQFYNARRDGQTIDNPKGWLFRVAHNLAVNRRKRDKFFD